MKEYNCSCPRLQAVDNETTAAERPHQQIHLLAPFGKAS